MQFSRFNIKKLVIAVLICAVLYGLVGFLLLPVFVKRTLENFTSEHSTAGLHIEQVRVNPFTMAMELSSTSLVDADNAPVIVLERVYLNVDITGLLLGTLVVRALDIERPQMYLANYGAGETTFSRLMSGSSLPGDDKEGMPGLLIKSVTVSEGTMHLLDRSAMPELQTEFRQLSFTARDISTQPGESSHYTLTINDALGGKLKFDGELQSGPIVSRGRFEARDIELGSVYPWFRQAALLDKVDGKLDISTEYDLSIASEIFNLLLAKTRLDLENFQLQPARLTIVQTDDISPQDINRNVGQLSLDKIHLADGSLDWQNRKVGLSLLSVDGGNLQYTHRQSGPSDWSMLIQGLSTTMPGEDTSPSWHVHADKVKTDNIELKLTDLSAAEPIEVVFADIEFLLSNLDTAPQQAGDFSLKMMVNQSTSLQGQGRLSPAESEVQVSMTVSDLNVEDFASYLKEFTDLQLRSGLLSADISVHYHANSFVIDGKAGGRDFVFLDRVSGESVLTLDEVMARGISVQGMPLVATVESLTLHGPYAKVEISPDRDLNLSAWFKSSRRGAMQTTGEDDKQEKGISLTVSQVEMSEGSIDFSDFSLSPQLDINIGDIGGAFSGFDIDPARTTSLDMQGRVGEFGSARITGRLRPFDVTRFSEINMVLNNIPTADLSNYAARFAGRKIESGKLNLDLTYQVKEGKLDGNHNIELSDLVLGERVESADALDLPLDMAIALLKDSDGRINIAIPISGDLDNPEFDLRAVISKAVGGLLSSIVTAPFKLLASLVGRSDKEMNSIPFEAGSAAIIPPALETITALSKLLQERPGLALRAVGSYDPIVDRDALARQQVRLHVFLAVGLEPDSPGRPRPVAFSDPKVQDVLDEFALSRLGKDRQTQIAGNDTAKEDNTEPDDAASEEEIYYENIFKELVQAEEIPLTKLERVARYRAQSIADQFERLGVAKLRVNVDDEIRTTSSSDYHIAVELLAEPGP